MTTADAPSRPTPDAEPVAARGGEARAVAARRWISEHGDTLWKFALARTRSKEAAEEIVQDTVLAAMQGYGKFAGGSSERTWLLGIAAHKVADHFRRARRAESPSAPGISPDATCMCATCRGMFTQKGMWACVASRWRDMNLSDAERAEQVEALRACIDALPPGQSEAVWLRDILGIPAGEVCTAMSLTDTNLWSRMHRARVALRSCLETKFNVRKEKRQ
ncbi:N/A [soil metagenome]